MEAIDPVIMLVQEAQLEVQNKGITANETRANYQKMEYTGGLPDLLAYLQKQTELTRKTLAAIVSESNRLKDFTINPQKYMDEVSGIVNRELYKLMIDGIKYEKLTVGQTEWSMQLFRDAELKDYFEQSLSVRKSVYTEVVYDSEVERRFAEDLV